MEVKREGSLITLSKLDGEASTKLQGILNNFINEEKGDVVVNFWKLKDNSFTIDIFCESDYVIKRLEEFLNIHGYVLRLTKKRVQV